MELQEKIPCNFFNEKMTAQMHVCMGYCLINKHLCVSRRSTRGFRLSVKDDIHHYPPQGFRANSTYSEQKTMQRVPRKAVLVITVFSLKNTHFKAEYLFA